MFKKLFFTTALALSPIVANADLLEFDWQVEGDGDVTLDTHTGKLWLDLDITANESIDGARLLIQNDPTFSQWRLPTLNEIYTLASNSFSAITDPTPATYIFGGPVTPQEITDFSVLGQALAGGGFTYGLYENDGDSHLFGTGNRDGLWLNYEWDYGTTFNRSYEGVYLIADSHSVSIDQAAINSTMSAYNASSPVAVGVFSLFGLALFRRQKKKDI